MYAPEIVCFCDIPVEDIHIHTAKYSLFGLAFSKRFIVTRGGCPVFYLSRDTQLRQLRDLKDFKDLQNLQLLEQVNLGGMFDHMVSEFHSLMDLFGDLLMRVRSTPGVPADYCRLRDLVLFLQFRVFSHVKFFDESLDDPENFHMERQWRVVGNVNFELSDIRRLIIPEKFGGPAERGSS